MSIKCYHCKGSHETVQTVKDCSKVETGTIVAEIVPALAVKTQATPAHRLAKKALFAKVPADKIVVGPVPTQVKEQILATIKTGQDLELGMYQDPETKAVYKVTWNKAKTYKYAHKLEVSKWAKKGKFWYVPSMMNKIQSTWKMDLDGAIGYSDWIKQQFGFGICCCCGAFLKAETSVLDGIGPVCKKKWL